MVISVINGEIKNCMIRIIILLIIPYIIGIPVSIVINMITAAQRKYNQDIVKKEIPNKLFS